MWASLSRAAGDSWYSSWQEESRHPAIPHPGALAYRDEREVLKAVLGGAGFPNSDL